MTMTHTYTETHTIVWAAVFGNYYPPEVLNLYDNEDAAAEHAADNDMVQVRRMRVYSHYRPDREQS